MPNLNRDRAKTAVLSMDIQKATVRRSSMFQERHVGQAAKSVLESARQMTTGGSLPTLVVLCMRLARAQQR